jgi:hypothetical protein
MDSLTRASIDIERDLGLPQHFLLDLFKEEDDWSLIIKMHALVEALISHLLMHAIGDPRLLRFFERLELGNVQTGKLVLAGTLELLDQNERRFIRLLSELRNRLVHDIRNVTFNLHTYIDGLDKNQRRSFFEATSYWSSTGTEKLMVSFQNQPKRFVWFTMLTLAIRVNEGLRAAKSHHVELEWVMERYDRFRTEMENDLGER